MVTSLRDFWKLVVDSRLLSVSKCQELHKAFVQAPGGAQQANAATLAEWLIAKRVLTRYQAKLLLAGRPGPFLYGDYLIRERIEDGRLAGLFRARHRATKHPVLLYFFAGSAVADPYQWASATGQARAAMSVSHPHVSRVFELVDLPSYKFLVLEDLQGQVLAERITGRSIPAGDACRLIQQAAEGLAQLHDLGLIHHDVRPQNLWLEPSGNIKLLFFPLSRDPLAPAELDFTAAGAARLQQAADYLAPELSQPGRTGDPQTDIYSLGCMLYQLITGRVPFAGGDAAAKIARHATEPIAPLDQVTGVPQPLAKVVAHAMAKNPQVRFASANTVAKALAPFAKASSAHKQTASSPTLLAYEQYLQAQRADESAATKSTVPANLPLIFPAAEAGIARNALQLHANAEPASGGAVTAIELSPQKEMTIAVAPATTSVLDYGRRRKRTNPVILGLSAAGGVLFLALVVFILTRPGKTPVESAQVTSASSETRDAEATKAGIQGTPDSRESVANGGTTSNGGQSVAGLRPTITEVDDDGKLLWTSPTHGAALELKYLPPGTQVFLILRPAEILAHAEGPKMLDALGPSGSLAKAQLEAIVRLGLDEIEQLTIGFYSREIEPRAAFVVRTRQKRTTDEWLSLFGNPSEAAEGEKKYYQGAGWAYYFPADGDGQTIAILPPDDVKLMLEAEGAPPLRREMEKLLADTDAKRHFTLLFQPGYLYGDGKPLFVGSLSRLRKPLSWFLGDTIQAALLSFHLSNDFFLEFRAYGTLDEDPYLLAKQFRERLGEIPSQVETYIVELNPHPYGKLILLRFPRMIEYLQEFTRVEAERRQAVLRCYLPGHAGHNLVMGTELALFEQPGATRVSTKEAPAKPMTADEALKRKISLSFPRNTLEKCMEMLAEEIGFEVVILGSDLQLDGITKNQSFALDERDKPAGEILRTVMKLANPDGKLVYVMKPKEPGGKEVIFITTRAAAEKRGDPLPAEFQDNGNPQTES